jgi:hypothetical protein
MKQVAEQMDPRTGLCLARSTGYLEHHPLGQAELAATNSVLGQIWFQLESALKPRFSSIMFDVRWALERGMRS